ncbi:MAG: hypothetical protein A3F72_03020 [Bacteroidetes bacterium RIFCSPLOWO2_12_FULL_35_15]|nr:MAG: hypothetical protein A3F72_03020 [Bacteroidetes bacterium RIFCSPLOWO2_12_FULL_35_15]
MCPEKQYKNSIKMDDITLFEDDNLGGIIRFKIAKADDVESIDDAIDGAITTEITLKANCRWYEVYATLGTIGYAEPTEDTNSGTVYKRNISAFSPKDTIEKTKIFNEMRNGKFIVDYTDSNKLRKIIGSIEEPVRFKYSLNTKSNIPELAGYNISFFGDGTHPAYVYDI